MFSVILRFVWLDNQVEQIKKVFPRVQKNHDLDILPHLSQDYWKVRERVYWLLNSFSALNFSSRR